METFLQCENEQALAQAAQRGHGGPILGETQRPSGDDPEQLTVAGGLGQIASRDPFPPQLFCELSLRVKRPL